MVIRTTESATSTVLASACGRYTAVTCRTPTLVSRKWHPPLSARYVKFDENNLSFDWKMPQLSHTYSKLVTTLTYRIWGLKYLGVARAPSQTWWNGAGTPTPTSGRRWTRWSPCWKLSTRRRAGAWFRSTRLRAASVFAGTEGREKLCSSKLEENTLHLNLKYSFVEEKKSW